MLCGESRHVTKEPIPEFLFHPAGIILSVTQRIKNPYLTVTKHVSHKRNHSLAKRRTPTASRLFSSSAAPSNASCSQWIPAWPLRPWLPSPRESNTQQDTIAEANNVATLDQPAFWFTLQFFLIHIVNVLKHICAKFEADRRQ